MFHLHVNDSADTVTLMWEKPFVGDDLTIKLNKAFKGNSNHWVSEQLHIPAENDNIRYKYIVKLQTGKLRKALNYASSIFTGDTCDHPITETNFRRLKWGSNEQYDIFHLPMDNNSTRSLFAGQLYFVKMIYDQLESPSNLKHALIECEHVHFGNSNYAREDKAAFFDWVSKKVNGTLSAEQSAFICSLLGQFVHHMGHNYCLSRSLDAKNANRLLSMLKCCPKDSLSKSSLESIYLVSHHLLYAASLHSWLPFITYFCNLFEVNDLLKEASYLRASYKEGQFNKLAEGAVQSVRLVSSPDDRKRLLVVIIFGASSINCLWNLHQLINNSLYSLTDSLTTAFVDAFCHFVSSSTQHRTQDLLEQGLWTRTPLVLKEQLAGPYCKSLVEQVKQETSWTDDKLKALRVLSLDKHIYSSEHGMQLISCISASKHLPVVKQMTYFLKHQAAKPFWQSLSNEQRQGLCITWLTSVVRLSSSSYLKKGPNENVLCAFQALEEICETLLLSRNEELCSALGRHLLTLLGYVYFETIVEVYQQIFQSASQFTKRWLLELLKAAVERTLKAGMGKVRASVKQLAQTLKSDDKKSGEKTDKAR